VNSVFRFRFLLLMVLGSAAAILSIVSLIFKDWIERAFGVDPDYHSGSLEIALIAVLVGACAMLFSSWAVRRHGV
jgi:hypothetical protein